MDIYWFTNEISTKQEDVAKSLFKFSHRVAFFKELSRLQTVLASKRAMVIFFSYTGTVREEVKLLKFIVTLPAIKNAHFIYFYHKESPDLAHLAACYGFRDLINLNLPAKEAVERVLFAIGGAGTKYESPKIGFRENQPTIASVPIRVTRVSKKNIYFETQLKVLKNQSFTISANCLKHEKSRTFEVVIEEVRTNKLLSRFQSSAVARFKNPLSSFNQLNSLNVGKHFRVYVIAKNPLLRTEIESQLDEPAFVIKHAIR